MNSFNASANKSLKVNKPQLKGDLVNSGTLAKAMLLPLDPGVPRIEFMFNPTELTFNGEVETNEQSGTQDKKEGTKKVSFSQVKAFSVTISKILFDTYETGENVVDKYIVPLQAAVKFIGSQNSKYSNLYSLPQGSNEATSKSTNLKTNSNPSISASDDKSRPPIYKFIWGDQIYIRNCFVEKLNYKLTMFLPDGTPVRAVIDSLVLKDAGTIKPSGDLRKTVTNRVKDSLESRLNFKANLKF